MARFAPYCPQCDIFNLSCIFPGDTERVHAIFCSCIKCKRNSRNNVCIEKNIITLALNWSFDKKKIRIRLRFAMYNKLRIALQNIIYLLYRSGKVESTVYFVRKTYRGFNQLDSKILKVLRIYRSPFIRSVNSA